MRELYDIMGIERALPAFDEQKMSFRLGHHIGLNIDQKLTLLTIEEERKRQEYLIGYLKDLIPSARKLEDIRKRAKMNGHFRDLRSPDL